MGSWTKLLLTLLVSLNPYSNGSTTMGAELQVVLRGAKVLILILMEVPQWGSNNYQINRLDVGLNPYSNGSTTMGTLFPAL